ncbi:DUF7561 family protein [Halalkalicoccus jeotgali]|uniref:Small CPxCG-related zinc finger protein n=1 Tax=Halalkalicoccus jeotgali (strain DSM 18796 / CECT 7217 / JCM 14584 / KCTC 4019 / B3) TaxID=795797 RepID=D8J575_HALJB|nr:hypothetical protein [Halalkalicoccus jeotgali]ADJ13656.1 hypothetical protein HacjB3_01315 [Halalkalicoccus jeotgali B3]ELY34297.1 hypothetical protein C497_18007 [Halalkalicoccus jeotgali B3]
MTPCDCCGEDVHVAGGIADIWSFSQEPTGGMILEFEDGTEHFLCYGCIERLPDDPEAADVAALSESR